MITLENSNWIFKKENLHVKFNLSNLIYSDVVQPLYISIKEKFIKSSDFSGITIFK